MMLMLMLHRDFRLILLLLLRSLPVVRRKHMVAATLRVGDRVAYPDNKQD